MIKKLLLASLVLAASAHSSLLWAHASIKDTATEGVASYHAVVIGHGCADESGYYNPVTAQTVVFPTGDALATATQNGAEVKVGTVSTFLTAGKFDGAVSLVPDRNIFSKQSYILNAANQVIGFKSTGGSVYTTTDGVSKFRGLVPFYVAAQSFVKTSCAKSAKIKVAIADICSNAYPPKERTANSWIPSPAQVGVSAYTVAGFNLDGVGSPATLTINRNLTTNPLPANCGTGIDVNIWPSAKDVDTYLIY